MELVDEIDDAPVALFLDYDDLLVPALTPLRKTVIFGKIRQRLQSLTSHCPLTVLSEYDCHDIARSIDLPELIYAGNNGLDIRGPTIRISTSVPVARQLNELLERINKGLTGIRNISIEAERLSLTVDFTFNPDARSAIDTALDNIVANDPKWRKTISETFFELRPNFFLNRQTAICQILKKLHPRHSFLPILISYDVGERDTLLALGERGIGIQVTPTAPAETSARYYLRNAAEVVECLDQLKLFFELRKEY